MSKPETRLQELHLTLPVPPKPVAKYKTAVLVGDILYVSGHGPAKVSEHTPLAGKVGGDLTFEQGKEAARAVGLNILATVAEFNRSLRSERTRAGQAAAVGRAALARRRSLRHVLEAPTSEGTAAARARRRSPHRSHHR